MSVPKLTKEERLTALQSAVEARRQRATVKKQLKQREINLEDVLKLAETKDFIGRAKVVEILRSVPRIGEKTAIHIMEELGISETRRVRGLGVRQREALILAIGKTAIDK